MNEPKYPMPILAARDASEAVRTFLRQYCDFTNTTPTRSTQLIDAIVLFTLALIDKRQEVAFEFVRISSSSGREGSGDFRLCAPDTLVQLVAAMFRGTDVRIQEVATSLASNFGDRIVLRASIHSVVFGGCVIWQRTNLPDSQ